MDMMSRGFGDSIPPRLILHLCYDYRLGNGRVSVQKGGKWAEMWWKTRGMADRSRQEYKQVISQVHESLFSCKGPTETNSCSEECPDRLKLEQRDEWEECCSAVWCLSVRRRGTSEKSVKKLSRKECYRPERSDGVCEKGERKEGKSRQERQQC